MADEVYSYASFTIDGEDVPLSELSDLKYRERVPDYGCDLTSLRLPSYTVTAECTVPMKSFEAFASMFRREPPGASALTLARRVKYGGRKGRSALRRLFKRALPIEMSMANGTRFHGKAVVLDETEMRVRLTSVAAEPTGKAGGNAP